MNKMHKTNKMYKTNKTITAYIFDRFFKGMSDADAGRVTHINYSFALIKEGRADVSHWHNEQSLRELMKRHPELPVSLSVGGWKADGFSQAVATAPGREMLADSLVQLVKSYGFAGLDLDWEYPADSVAGIASAPEDVTNFPVFVNLLREKLGDNHRLTMAVGASEKCAAGIHYQDMAAAVDQINVMSYDLAPWGIKAPTAHHAPLYPSKFSENGDCGHKAIEVYARAGVPRSKLVLGAAFYGRFHSGVQDNDQHGLNAAHESEFPNGFPYREVADRLAGTGARFWDEEAKAPYLYDPTDRLFVTYDDPESLYWKTRYVKEKELGGIMFWEYLGPDTGELLAALYEGMTALP